MLRICIPVHNEATTIGVLLWRLRSVFQGFSREYDVVVYDDASTDGTDEVLEPYRSVMPLTVIRGEAHRGYAASIDALVRHVAADDEYARRDAMVLLQGDFTESPEHLPELVKRFEGGADLVAVHRTVSDATPADERRLRRWGRWAIAPFLRLPAVADPFTGFRLVRISVLRDLLRALGSRPICAGDGWAANIDFAINVAPFARRIENVEFAPRYDVRQRASRRRGWTDVMALFHWARAAKRVSRPVPGGKPAADAPGRPERQAEVAVTPIFAPRSNKPAERQDQDSAERGGRPGRERGNRGPRNGDATESRNGRAARPERPAQEPRPPRPPRPPRGERPERLERPERPEQPEKNDVIHAAAAAVPGTDSAPDPTIAGPESPDASAPGELSAGAKKSRRRRRRSRRERAAGAATADGTAPTVDGMPAGRPSGASDDGVDGDDDDDGEVEVESAESSSGGASEAGSDSTRRKRRSRRRRRGRKPGGPESAGGADAPAPPAVEPPAA